MSFVRRLLVLVVSCALLSGMLGISCIHAQQAPNTDGPQPTSESGVETASTGQPAAQPTKSINVLSLLFLGGWFMIPLGALSLAVVALAIERGVALRGQRMLPDRLVTELGELSQRPGGLDPRTAYRLCQKFPSAAGDVMRNVLVKVGRPHAELERTLSESSQRIVIRLQQPVSWLTLIAAVAPLIGLLGTVWGITQAFYDTTQLQVGQNRAEALSAGIYVALVTTIVGLTIAIPATLISHFFENRIVRSLNQIEEMIAQLLPQLERYEGQVRFKAAESTVEAAHRDSAWGDWDLTQPKREPQAKG